jgi:hypothetical protein
MLNFWQFCDKHWEGVWLLAIAALIALVVCVLAVSDRPKR